MKKVNIPIMNGMNGMIGTVSIRNLFKGWTVCSISSMHGPFIICGMLIWMKDRLLPIMYV